jgi:hypothetical protein
MAAKRNWMLGLVLGVAALATSVGASAGVILSPVGAVVDAGGSAPNADILNTHDQSGLSVGFASGFTDFDTYLAGNPKHTALFENAVQTEFYEWFSSQGTNSATVTYDLGAEFTIDRLALWNEESAGIGLLDLYYSTDGTLFSALSLGLTPFDNPLADYPAEVFSFAPTDARYVRFVMSSCPQPDPGTFEACAIGEVAFRVAETGQRIPEPATLALLGIGLAALGALRRRKPD